jgi:hypothetical protein
VKDSVGLAIDDPVTWASLCQRSIQSSRRRFRSVVAPSEQLLGCADRSTSGYIAASIPAGVEFVPDACKTVETLRSEPRDTVDFDRYLLDEALNALVQFAPAYEWGTSGRTILFRPRVASRDTSHFLRQPIAHFMIIGSRIEDALAELRTVLGPDDYRNPPRFPTTSIDLSKTVDLDLRDTSVLDVLNSLIARHGRIVWDVSYCGPSTAYEFSRIALTTFDGAGIAAHAIFLKTPDGRRYDPCARGVEPSR